MRLIDTIILHCSATLPGQECDAHTIDGWHKANGWDGIGYHFIVLPDGIIEYGRPISIIGAHCKGFNESSIGICYIGGYDHNSKPADTRTDAQKKALADICLSLYSAFPDSLVVGHRDLTHDRDCPCFDANPWFETEYQKANTGCWKTGWPTTTKTLA
jgi:N-acetylmuramoyl-L-alanine amidase